MHGSRLHAEIGAINRHAVHLLIRCLLSALSPPSAAAGVGPAVTILADQEIAP